MPRRPFSLKDFRTYCLGHLGATEDWPFGPETAVYRVKKKIFALVAIDREPFQFNLKCDPDYAEALRKNYRQIIPGYHMNKRHWNTIIPDAELPLDLIHEMIDHSYELIIAQVRSTSG